jgi:hypothetical protein
MLKFRNLVYFSAFFRASWYSGSLNDSCNCSGLSHTMIATRDFGGSPDIAVADPAARYFPPCALIVLSDLKLKAPPDFGQVTVQGPGFSYTAKPDLQHQRQFAET